MSDVVPASFFPTPHEIAGGLRWMREHPVVATAAAAAATAVSVLTYLKSRAEEESAAQFATSRGSSKSLQLGVQSSEQEPTWSDCDEELQMMAAADVTNKTRSSSDELLLLKSKQRRRGEMMKTNDEVYSATESEVSTTSPTVRRSHPSSLSVSNFAFSCGAADQEDGVGGGESDRQEGEGGEEERGIRSLAKDASAALRFGFPESVMEEDDDNSASPQWGWYVSTTPPDEYYT